MKKLFFLLFLIVKIINAQEETPAYIKNHADFTPETPNASSFLIYGDTPVNNSTGIPNINIPLFTIEEDGVSIPISLSYHASGVKVDDLASIVGLKWTLNAGGGIFRQVNDNPDEIGWLQPQYRGFVTPEWIAAQEQIDSWVTQREIGFSDVFDDYIPDDFNYSFLNHSGSFIFNQDGTTEHEKQATMFIKKNNGVGNSFYFDAHDGYGTTYHFDSNATEANGKQTLYTSDTGGANLSRDSHITGWMLSKLVTKNNSHVNFSYIPHTLEYYIANTSNSITVAPGCVTTSPTCGCSGSGVVSNTSISSTAIQYSTLNRLISTIESTNIKVSFNYTDDNTLSTWKKQLNSITVLDKIEGKTKTFIFTYSKFPGDPRLRLDEVQEIGFDNLAKPAYKFYYEAGSLPSKGNMSKDFHGYYNGEDNTSLVPYSVEAYNTIATTYRSRLANRRENLQFLRIGTLNKIIYPTGGSTEFDYEANAVPSTNVFNPIFKPKNASAHGSGSYTLAGEYRVIQVEFTISKNLETLGTPVNYAGTSDICVFEQSIDCSQFNIYPKLSNGSLGTPIFSPYKVIGAEGSVNLLQGDYVLELKIEDNQLVANPTALISVNLNWEEQEDIITATDYTGGLRVKSVLDKDANGAIVRQTRYSYDGLKGYSLNIGNTIKGYGESGVFSSNNIAVSPSLIKSGYFYEKVTVDKLGVQDTIRSVEHYTDGFRNKSYEPQLIKQQLYNGNNKIQETLYSYDNTTVKELQFWTLGDKTFCFTPENANNVLLGYSNPNSTNYYHRKNVLLKKVIIDYFSEFGESFDASIKISSYQYNDDMQVKEIISDGRYYVNNEQEILNKNFSLNSEGSLTSIEFTYPNNHTTENSVIAGMLANYQVGLPISKKIKVDSQLTQGQYLDYDTNGNVIGDYRYNKGQVANASGVGHIPSNYELYETYSLVNGKPVEIKRKDGLPTAVLWDTTHTYVLAQLVGASKAELDSITGAIDLRITTDLQLQTLYNNLRIALPQAQITTFMHNPLKGVVQITDTNGYTISYDYDGLSRLIRTKDQDNFLLSEQKYHYINQN